MLKRVLKHFHMCCGLGGGAKGFNRAKPVVGHIQAEWRCIGGVDVDPAGLRDFERLSGVPGTLMDLFTRDQYTRFHAKEPPAGWRKRAPTTFGAPRTMNAPTQCSFPAHAKAPLAYCPKQ